MVAFRTALSVEALRSDLYQHYLRQFGEPIASAMSDFTVNHLRSELQAQRDQLAKLHGGNACDIWLSLLVYS